MPSSPPTLRELRGLFVDESLLAVGRALDEAASPHRVLYPGHPRCPSVPAGTRDVDVLRFVGERDLMLLTRDKRMRTGRDELAAIHEHGAKLVVFMDKIDPTPRDALRTFLNRWDKVSRAAGRAEAGPWAMSISEHGGPDRLNLRQA